MSKDRCTVTDHKTCFSTDSGMRVLANLMTEAKFFDIITTPEEMAVENFVKILLSKIGVYPAEKKSSAERIDMFVSNMMKMKMEY
ncbi:MAG: hypothetical protein ACUZ9M_00540 [Candidatus Scalindua sp.]